MKTILILYISLVPLLLISPIYASYGVGVGCTQSFMGDNAKLSYSLHKFKKSFNFSYHDFHPNLKVSEIKKRDKEMASVADISFNLSPQKTKYKVFMGTTILFGLYNDQMDGTGHVTEIGYHLSLINNRGKDFYEMKFSYGEIKGEQYQFFQVIYGIKLCCI